jgi:hypothetical protein
MSGNNLHPYWGRAVQIGQKPAAKPQSGRPQQQQPRDNGGFDSLIVGKESVIKLGTGETVKGVVSAASKYFYLISIDGQVTIINKAFVVSITPIQNLDRGGDDKQNSQGGWCRWSEK